jgi:hypothetical protein
MFFFSRRKLGKGDSLASPRCANTRRAVNRRRLWLEALEDRTLPSASNPFYDLTTVASTADGTFTSFGDMPSLNNNGYVAFTATTAGGNDIWLADPKGNLTNITFADDPGRSFGRGVALNDGNQIVAREQLGTQFLVRVWNGNGIDEHTDLFHTPVPVLGSPDDQFDSAQQFTAIDNAGPSGSGDVAFVAYDASGGVRDIEYESWLDLGDGTYQPVTEVDANGQASPRPQFNNAGQMLYVTPTGQLILWSPASGPQVLESQNTGFNSIDPGAGISQNGRVIVFSGNRGYGEGLFALYQSTSGWQLMRLAGEGWDDFTFDTSSNVVVNDTWNTQRGDTIVFAGTSKSLGPGIYSIRLSFFGTTPYDTNPITATSIYASGVTPVARVGDVLPNGANITGVSLGEGVNNLGRGNIVFWATDSNGNQDIELADPRQVIWLNFDPLSFLPYGAPAENEALLAQMGITDYGWSGATDQALSRAGITYNAATVQDEVVDEVQQMYDDAGARVTVLGHTTDTLPSYIQEPVITGEPNGIESGSDTGIRHGVYQTVYIGDGPVDATNHPDSEDLGYGSAPPAAAGGLDFYDQIPDSIALVYANNIFNPGYDDVFGGTAPSQLPQDVVVNAIATIIAHESGHNFGLFHLDPIPAGTPDTGDIMIKGTQPGEFQSPPPEFSHTDLPTIVSGIEESSADRLDWSTNAPNGDPPDPALVKFAAGSSTRANIGFPAATTLQVQHLYVGVVSPFADAITVLQDLGPGDLATLLNNANLPVDPADQLVVFGSTDGTSIDVVGVAQGNEGAQDSLSMTVLGLTTDNSLQAPVSGTGAALHFYQVTASGDVDLGLAPIETTPVNHAPTLAPISNQAVTFGSTVTFTASASDPDMGQTLTYSLGAGAPIGASIDPASGAFTWTPTTAQAGQIYNFNVVVTDNGTAPLSDAQPVTINILNRLQAIAVTELIAPNPGPMQVAVDFNEPLQSMPAQTVSNYKIVSQGGISLPIGSAVYSDNGTQHRVVLTIASGTTVIPDVYNVLIDAPNLTATNGDLGEPKADQLWVDVTGENTLKPIMVEPDGSFAVSGPDQFLGYAPPEQVIDGNFTGSGHTDLIALCTDGTVLLLKNNGDNTYAAPVPVSLGGAYTVAGIATVDWNHDGSPDLVVAATQNSNNYYLVLLNDGHGNFSNAPETPIPISSTTALTPFAVYDLSGNGQYEIIHDGGLVTSASDYGDRALEVIGKDPYLGYTAQMELPLGISSDYSPLDGGNLVYIGNIGFADLNGDGKPDMIVGLTGYYADAPNFSVILSTPNGYAAGQQIVDAYGGFGSVAIGIGNFSGTGHNDIAKLTTQGVQIYRNDGTGKFTEPDAPIIFNYKYIRAATFADLNHDGIPDLVLIIQPLTPDGAENGEPLSVWTLMADGHGGFNPTTPAPIPLAGSDVTIPSSMVLADVDGDGNPDVVLGSSDSGEIRIAINDGSGTMRPPIQPLPFLGSVPATSVSGVSAQAFADFNNSGHRGFATLTPGGVDVYVGRSDGGFQQTAFLQIPNGTGSGRASWIKVADLNNDGIPDILCPAGDGGIAVYLGNGNGTFQPARTFSSQAGDSIIAVTLADVNNDGNLDVVATIVLDSYSGFDYGVFFGDGKGNLAFNINTLVPIGLFNSTFVHPLSATLADFNGDGKLDLLVPTYNAGFSLTDYLGNGNGTFTPGPVVYTGSQESDALELTADLNTDGKLDLITVTDATARIYLGDGHGAFKETDSVNLSVGGDVLGQPIAPGGIALGQFTGDGSYYLAATDGSGYYSVDGTSVTLYKIDATGHFGAPQIVTVGATRGAVVSIPRAPFLDAGTFAVTDHTPLAVDDKANVLAGTSATIDVLANDSHPDHAPLTVVQVSSPAHGTVHITDNGTTVTYAPAANFQGTDTFTYTIADPAGVEATATVTVTVQSITIAPPTFPDAQVQTKYSQQLTASGGTAPYTFAVTAGTLPQGLTLSSAGLLSGTPTTVGAPTFTVTVTDKTGLSVPIPFTLTVDPLPTAPTVTSDPADQLIDAGQSVTFQAQASGVPSPTVQWQVSTDGGKTFADIPGATTGNVVSRSTIASYSFTAQPGQDGNRYRVQFSNGVGQPAVSAAATLTVQYPPVLSTQPADQEIVAGGVVSFSAAAAGDPPVTGVQWQVSTDGGSTFTNITGATSPTYRFIAALGEDGNKYQAVFTNSIGSTSSQVATLRVPSVSVTPLPAISFPSFSVSWADANNTPGETFDVLVSVDGGAWTPWLTQTAQSTETYNGELGHHYAFFAQADGVYNAPPPFTETQTATPIWERTLPSEPENTASPSASTISALLQSSFRDPDRNTKPGIAVVATNGIGQWQFATRTKWVNVGSASAAQARLLPKADQLRFLPAPGWTGQAGLLFQAWDGSQGSPGGTAAITVAGGGAPFSINAGEVTVQVTSTGTAPVWTTTGVTLSPVLPGTMSPAGDTIASAFGPWFSGGSGTTGIAVTGLTGTASGSWQFSLDDGQTWKPLGKSSAAAARLLSNNDRIRFVPAMGFAGMVTLQARAWDGNGTDGSLVNLSARGATGGNTDVGGNLITANLAVNHAPVLSSATGPTLPAVVENTTGAAISIGKLLGSASDPDKGAQLGVAVVAATGPGAWQFALGSGAWQTLGLVSESAGLLLNGTARLRFVPALDQTGQASLTYRAWDRTAGISGTSFATGVTGDASPISAAEATATLAVTAGLPGPTWLRTSATFRPVSPFPNQSAGDTVASVFGPLFADVNIGATVGIAVIGLTGTQNGVWQYQLDGTSTWVTIASASASKALLLSGTDGVRFVPSKGFLGQVKLQALAWDGTGTHGTTVNLSGRGKIGAGTAFSSLVATAQLLVNTSPQLSA